LVETMRSTLDAAIADAEQSGREVVA
jgi:hypothetical protein